MPGRGEAAGWEEEKGGAPQLVCEDHLRDVAGVAADFPYYDELTDKQNLGLKSGPDKQMLISPRKSYMERLEAPPSSANRVSKASDKRKSGDDDSEDETSWRKKRRRLHE